MKTPNPGYGYRLLKAGDVTAIGDEYSFNSGSETWFDVDGLNKGIKLDESSLPVRRKIDPGAGWEIVPENEVETGEMEFSTNDGASWDGNRRCNNHQTCGWYSEHSSLRYIFRRRVPANGCFSKPPTAAGSRFNNLAIDAFISVHPEWVKIEDGPPVHDRYVWFARDGKVSGCCLFHGNCKRWTHWRYATDAEIPKAPEPELTAFQNATEEFVNKMLVETGSVGTATRLAFIAGAAWQKADMEVPW